jgi:hypothetical protein
VGRRLKSLPRNRSYTRGVRALKKKQRVIAAVNRADCGPVNLGRWTAEGGLSPHSAVPLTSLIPR